jgi:hypothetical protein
VSPLFPEIPRPHTWMTPQQFRMLDWQVQGGLARPPRPHTRIGMLLHPQESALNRRFAEELGIEDLDSHYLVVAQYLPGNGPNTVTHYG